MSYHLTMLAYDMNDEPLSYGHGAPLRLRNDLTRATIWGRSSWHRADLHGLSDRGETCALASLV
jgi:hypothetical protein